LDDRSNNQVSREILTYLDEHYPKAVKFSEMVINLGINEKTLFKNLFFLEDNSLIQLMCSYPAGATFPSIHMIKGREEGITLLNDADRLESMFPVQGFAHSMDYYKMNNVVISEVVSALSSEIKNAKGIEETKRSELVITLDNIANSPLISDIKLGKILENL